MIQKNDTYYFFLGIGGIGMSALARYLKFQGKYVLGYDAVKTELTLQLETEGINVFYEDCTEILPEFIRPDNTVVIRTPAIRSGNLISFFRRNDYKIYKRGEFLAKIVNQSNQIAIAGTHGKTSTTAITAHILNLAGKLKAGFVGGIVKNYNSNLILSTKGSYFVVEADEYDKAFLHLKPTIAAVTSIEPDHLDVYGDFSNLVSAFNQFITNDERNLHAVVNKSFAHYIDSVQLTYGINEEADFWASDIRYHDRRQYFRLHLLDKSFETFIALPGKAFLSNAVAAAAVAYLANIDWRTIKAGLETYKGTDRRFDLRYTDGKQYIYDDYAHHPSEILALYEAARSFFPEAKLTIVFQPHLYSRTRDLAEKFAVTLDLFDNIIVTDIYPAREQPIAGVDPQLILSKIQNQNKRYVPITSLVDHLVKNGFQVLFITGAGDVNRIIPDLIKKIQNQNEA